MIRPIILVVGFIAVMAIFFAIAYKKNLLDTRPSSVIPNMIMGRIKVRLLFGKNRLPIYYCQLDDDRLID